MIYDIRLNIRISKDQMKKLDWLINQNKEILNASHWVRCQIERDYNDKFERFIWKNKVIGTSTTSKDVK